MSDEDINSLVLEAINYGRTLEELDRAEARLQISPNSDFWKEHSNHLRFRKLLTKHRLVASARKFSGFSLKV